MDSITPSPREGIGVMGRRPGPGVNETDVAPNLPTLTRARTLALQGGEEVRKDQPYFPSRSGRSKVPAEELEHRFGTVVCTGVALL